MTDLNLDEIKFILNMANEQNVTELEYRGLRIKFKNKEPVRPIEPYPPAPQSLASAIQQVAEKVARHEFVPHAKAEDLIKPLNPLDDLTPEEILYYAVPHYDQIQAEKEAHKKKLEDEKINGGEDIWPRK